MKPGWQSMRAGVLKMVRAPFLMPTLERYLASKTLGSPYKGFLSKLPPNPCDYPFGTHRDVVRYGFRMRLDLSDLVPWYLYWGFLDPSHETIVENCRSGDVVLDVGANIGITVLRIAKHIGCTGKVFGFEPDPTNFSVLNRHIELNGLTNAEPINAAVSDHPGELFLNVTNARNRGMSQVSTTGSGESIRVPALTLDSFVAEREVGPVNLIKVDAEGFEHRVLLGAEAILRRDRPRLCLEVIDSNLRLFDCSAYQLVGWVRRLGYDVRDAVTGELITESAALNDASLEVVCRPTP